MLNPLVVLKALSQLLTLSNYLRAVLMEEDHNSPMDHHLNCFQRCTILNYHHQDFYSIYLSYHTVHPSLYISGLSLLLFRNQCIQDNCRWCILLNWDQMIFIRSKFVFLDQLQLPKYHFKLNHHQVFLQHGHRLWWWIEFQAQVLIRL